MPLPSGSTFAGFRIIRLLGSGGMGEVYVAQHPRLPRRDALKLLPPEWSTDHEYRTRFIREADLASTLWHPSIVGVHDRGEADGQLWISMDFVDGLDAARLLADRYPVGMPIEDVVRIVSAVAGGLDYAHKQGLLHRDVKPANIMLTHLDDGGEQRVLLTDFGIARNINDISGLTATNMTVGTVAYCAPEQLMGEAVDGRADQYALAATAYHLLTGSHLFPHSNPAVVISRHLNSAPPELSKTRPELAKLDPILSAALAKEPSDRYDRCGDFAQALAEQAATVVSSPAAATTPAAAVPKRQVPDPSALAHLPPAATTRSRNLALVNAALWSIALLAIGAFIVWHPWEGRGSTVTATPSTSATPPPSTITAVTATTPAPLPLPPPATSLVTNTAPPQPTTTQYPRAGELGDYCSTPKAIGTGVNGELYYCARVQYTDGYKWSLTPDVIPNTLPPADIPPGSSCMVPGLTADAVSGTLWCEPGPNGGWTWQLGGAH